LSAVPGNSLADFPCLTRTICPYRQ